MKLQREIAECESEKEGKIDIRTVHVCGKEKRSRRQHTRRRFSVSLSFCPIHSASKSLLQKQKGAVKSFL